jgi:glycosyltransferase involved in cell wall biosynthesis
MSKNHLIIAVQWKKKGAIGGMAQRMLLTAVYLHDSGRPFLCLTSKSLASHLGINPQHPALHVINDDTKLLYRSFIACFKIFFQILSRKIISAHFGGGGIFEKLLFRVSSIFIKTSCTFASKSLEMATHGNKKTAKTWISLLNASDKIDVLNPTHDLHNWAHKITISPNSFPARWYTLRQPLIPMEKKNLCVFSGAFEKTKNPLLAIEIFENTLTMYPALREKTKLILFGTGALTYQVQQKLQILNQKFNAPIAIIGEENDYFHTLAYASVFFSLQDYDNYPSQSLMESMLFGCKILATNEGDTYLMLPPKSQNKLIDKNKPISAAHDLAKLLQNTHACETNRKHILMHHTLENYARYFENFIKNSPTKQ